MGKNVKKFWITIICQILLLVEMSEFKIKSNPYGSVSERQIESVELAGCGGAKFEIRWGDTTYDAYLTYTGCLYGKMQA